MYSSSSLLFLFISLSLILFVSVFFFFSPFYVLYFSSLRYFLRSLLHSLFPFIYYPSFSLQFLLPLCLPPSPFVLNILFPPSSSSLSYTLFHFSTPSLPPYSSLLYIILAFLSFLYSFNPHSLLHPHLPYSFHHSLLYFDPPNSFFHPSYSITERGRE